MCQTWQAVHIGSHTDQVVRGQGGAVTSLVSVLGVVDDSEGRRRIVGRSLLHDGNGFLGGGGEDVAVDGGVAGFDHDLEVRSLEGACAREHGRGRCHGRTQHRRKREHGRGGEEHVEFGRRLSFPREDGLREVW